jgi:polyferredoxin
VLADLILVVHFGYVLFVVGGLGLIWLGHWAQWPWVRNFWFRVVHMAAIGVVAIEALIGWVCPLTVLEDQLRPGTPQQAGFLARWLHRVLFWDFPAWTFTLVYVAFALLCLATWKAWPPERMRRGVR